MHEVGPDLKPAIKRYLERQPMSEKDIRVMRAYLGQWIFSLAWDANPSPDWRDDLKTLRKGIPMLLTRDDIDNWVKLAVHFGVDPL